MVQVMEDKWIESHYIPTGIRPFHNTSAPARLRLPASACVDKTTKIITEFTPGVWSSFVEKSWIW